MKKITLKSMFAFFALVGTIAVNAQQAPLSISKKLLKEPITLTEESQRSLAETGFVRCASVEMHERRMQRESNVQTKEEFEDWLAPLVEAHKAELAQQRANGNVIMAAVEIPIVFHIITDGTGATNLSAAQVQAQIDQLNIDFGNGAGSTHPAAADAQIVFVPALKDPSGTIMPEPGIDRVTTFGAGPFPTSDFDQGDGGLEIKPATIWDRSKYANIWTADITGGILGYAQFPSNSTLPGFPANGGSALNDGVVIGYGTVGSVANPGPAAPYNLGRTLTHEVGHWIGLRHIWGDANCGDDYCADTPESTTSNGGCPTQTTCDGIQDMVENYMDYTNDSCMNIFTADQVARMVTVLNNADGISDLPNSDVTTIGPVISFANATQTINESTDCSFTDVIITVNIAGAPSANADVTITSSGSATAADYQIIGGNLTFPTGSSASQTFTLRVYNDGFVESDETITLGMNLNANGGDATITPNPSQENAITLVNDNVVPNASTLNVVAYYDMEDLTGWTILDDDGDGNNWGVVTGLTWPSVEGAILYSETDLNILGGPGPSNADPDNYVISPVMTIPAEATNTEFTFGVGGYNNAEHYAVYFTTDITDAASMNGGTLIEEGDTLDSTSELRTVNIGSLAGQTGYVVVRHFNSDANSGLLLFDTLTVTATSNTGVQTALNSGTPNQTALSLSGTIYTSNVADGNMMADVTNNNGVDYGCVSTSVSRASGASVQYQTPGVANYVMGKTFTITPSSVQAAGNATLKFYFTEAEIAQWESETGNVRGDLMVIKDNGVPVASTATIGAFGPNVTLETTFSSGINGTYYFGLPVALTVGESDFEMFSVYPNPSNGNVNISLSSEDDVKVSLFDIRGRIIYTEVFNNNSATFNKELDFNAVASGVYMLNVESGAKKATKKVVVK